MNAIDDESYLEALNHVASKWAALEEMSRAADKWARTDAENRALRGLVGDMYKTINGLKAKINEWLPCKDSCPHRKFDCIDLHEDCWYKVRMGELGIEVSK